MLLPAPKTQKLWSLKPSHRSTEPCGLSPQADMPTRLSDPTQQTCLQDCSILCKQTGLQDRSILRKQTCLQDCSILRKQTCLQDCSNYLLLQSRAHRHCLNHTHTTTCFNALTDWLLTFTIIMTNALHALQDYDMRESGRPSPGALPSSLRARTVCWFFRGSSATWNRSGRVTEDSAELQGQAPCEPVDAGICYEPRCSSA